MPLVVEGMLDQLHLCDQVCEVDELLWRIPAGDDDVHRVAPPLQRINDIGRRAPSRSASRK